MRKSWAGGRPATSPKSPGACGLAPHRRSHPPKLRRRPGLGAQGMRRLSLPLVELYRMPRVVRRSHTYLYLPAVRPDRLIAQRTPIGLPISKCDVCETGTLEHFFDFHLAETLFQ